MTSYSWEDSRVWEYISKYRQSSMLKSFADRMKILVDDVLDEIVSLHKGSVLDTVCLVREDSFEDFFFFFFFVCLITYMHIWFPLYRFIMEVLQILNVAPTQLHPNSWVVIQAFHLLFLALSLRLSLRSFYIFITLGWEIGWGCCL